jgi:hypothetical protein
MPQSTVLYEGLYFLLFPRTLRGVMAFTVWSWVGYAVQIRIAAAATSTAALQWAAGNALVVVFYLPALALVLCRPNHGVTPRWMERRAVR